MISNFRSNNNLTREKLIMLSSFRWVKVLQCIRKTKASFLYEKQDLEKQEWGFQIFHRKFLCRYFHTFLYITFSSQFREHILHGDICALTISCGKKFIIARSSTKDELKGNYFPFPDKCLETYIVLIQLLIAQRTISQSYFNMFRMKKST